MNNKQNTDTAVSSGSELNDGFATDAIVRTPDIVERLYNNTPNVHDSVEAGNEIQELRALLDPRRWTKETRDKWHQALPDLYAAFRAIRGG